MKENCQNLVEKGKLIDWQKIQLAVGKIAGQFILKPVDLG